MLRFLLGTTAHFCMDEVIVDPAGGGGNAPQIPAAPWNGIDGVYKVGEGDKATEWFNTITEQPVRDLMIAKQYKNPAELAVAYSNVNKMMNMQPEVQAMLAGTATDDQRASFYTKMGRPENADKYDLTFANKEQADPNMTKFGKDLFFELGLNNKQAQAAVGKWDTFVAEHYAAEAKATETANATDMTALQTRWGADLEANKAAGSRAMQALGLSADLVGKIEGSIGSAAIVELLAAIGKKSAEGGFTGGGGAPNGDPNNVAGMSKEQAQAEINRLSGDTEFQKKYTDVKHPENRTAVERMKQLYLKVG